MSAENEKGLDCSINVVVYGKETHGLFPYNPFLQIFQSTIQHSTIFREREHWNKTSSVLICWYLQLNAYVCVLREEFSQIEKTIIETENFPEKFKFSKNILL